MQGRTKLLVGLDEAGYGPNLGPLVVTAVSLQLPEQVQSEDRWELLAPEVSTYPAESQSQVVIDDSKRAYSGGGLATLERAALAWMALSHGVPETLHELWSLYSLTPMNDFEGTPWYTEEPLALPVAICPEELERAQRSLLRCLKRAGCREADLACHIILPARFNLMLKRAESKGQLLFSAASELLRELDRRSAVANIEIVADKQGGRHYYRHLLQDVFPDTLVMAGREGRQISHYVVARPRRKLDLRFVAQADGLHLLVAAASMIAKYIRELCMRRFNAFWNARLPALKPTAGYPEDAARFLKQVEPVARECGIRRSMYWRLK